MKQDIEILDLIERYLNEELNSEELEQFEKQLASDQTFAAQVDAQRSIHKIVEEASYLDMKDSIRQVHENTHGGNSVSVLKNVILAGGALIILGTLLLLLRNSAEESLPEDPQIITDTQEVVTVIDSINPDESAEIPASMKQSILPRKYTAPPNTVKDSSRAMGTPNIVEDSVQTAEQSGLENPEIIETKAKIEASPKAASIEIENKTEKSIQTAAQDSIDCSKVEISARVVTAESCRNKATGKLFIEEQSLLGGIPPYETSIDDGENYYQKREYEQLPAGIYYVWVRDKHSCKSSLGYVRVGSKDCSLAYVFAPEKDEQWKIPEVEQDASLKIFNQQGSVVYEEYLRAGITSYWRGTDKFNNPLPMGAYSFAIESNNGHMITGNVTIVR